MRSMCSTWKGSIVLVAVLAIGASGCRTVGTFGRSLGDAAGERRAGGRRRREYRGEGGR